jgi:hypothetical protein
MTLRDSRTNGRQTNDQILAFARACSYRRANTPPNGRVESASVQDGNKEMQLIAAF